MDVWRNSAKLLLLFVLCSKSAESKLIGSHSPTFPELQHFPLKDGYINIAEEIANAYNNFGILILDDKRGSKVAAIAETKHGNSVAITVEILRQWLLGKGRMPVTWLTLIKCLRDTGLNVLADDIKGALSQEDESKTPDNADPSEQSESFEYSWITIVGTGVGGVIVVTVVVLIQKRAGGVALNLTERDLYVLSSVTRSAAPQWKEVGLALGFLDYELTTIERKPMLIPEGDIAYFRVMMSQWLKWAPPNHSWPTIEALAIALRSSGHEGLAFNLRQLFLQKKGYLQGHQVLATVTSSPPRFVEPQVQNGSAPSTITANAGAADNPSPTAKADWPWGKKAHTRKSLDEKKSPYSRDPNKPKKVKLTFEYEAVAQHEKPYTINKVYPMQNFPHGTCVIINNRKFTDHEDREGTEIDEKNLSKMFRYLGYNVEIYRDCKASEIVAVFNGLQERNFSEHDSFVCCILSHGQEGKIIGSDSRPIELDDITSLFTADKCPTLSGKPKMFFIQACRLMVPTKVVKKFDHGVRTSTDDGGQLIRTGTRPVEADFFLGYATPQGYPAFRNLDDGSWYILELCRVFCAFATFTKLQDMITMVNENVGTCYQNYGYCQAPSSEYRLGKEVYFF